MTPRVLRELAMTSRTCPCTLIQSCASPRTHINLRLHNQRPTCACLSARSKPILNNWPAISPDPETLAYSVTVGLGSGSLASAKASHRSAIISSLRDCNTHSCPTRDPITDLRLIARKRASGTPLWLISLFHRCGWLLMPFCPWSTYSGIRRGCLLPCRSSL